MNNNYFSSLFRGFFILIGRGLSAATAPLLPYVLPVGSGIFAVIFFNDARSFLQRGASFWDYYHSFDDPNGYRLWMPVIFFFFVLISVSAFAQFVTHPIARLAGWKESEGKRASRSIDELTLKLFLRDLLIAVIVAILLVIGIYSPIILLWISAKWATILFGILLFFDSLFIIWTFLQD